MSMLRRLVVLVPLGWLFWGTRPHRRRRLFSRKLLAGGLRKLSVEGTVCEYSVVSTYLLQTFLVDI